MTVRRIAIEDYNYELPDERIAKFPLERRDRSKLLLHKNGQISESRFCHLPEQLPADSLLVFNNTKVIYARLIFQKATGARIEIFCLEPAEPHDYELVFKQTGRCVWKCMIGNRKKWKGETLSRKITVNGKELTLSARIVREENSSAFVELAWDNAGVTFAELLDSVGELPIPPYLNRSAQESDKQTYQTVYSKIKGSVAAPTAGLHFTPEVFNDLKNKGIETAELTLHVGAGTFQPVKSETIADHAMHAETVEITLETLQHLRRKTGNIIAVGTTSVRTLESLYYIGLQIENARSLSEIEAFRVGQWTPYSLSNAITAEKALDNIIQFLQKNNLEKLPFSTRIIIAPSYQFRLVKGIITNFHQPKSTLLLLIAAFVGERWKEMYDYALENDFRFLSYGDSSLLI
ncbi:MAG: S-adenosylmethionine:tRNA ribosyltransferase-isomerase [Prevotellaceae bacterium]|jgi:S-adenosylmethionine:tRNA ribosyltransferase-isomerase|nr:S-adenosylmethionine:tRNA ribosyltransferase-isomerase [Prevotellaceae bacterium]